MELGGTRRANGDSFHVLRADLRVFTEDFFKRIDRSVIAAAAGIGFEADVQGLELFAEVAGQVGQVGLVAESRAEASVRRLENILDAGKSFGRKQRAIDTRL